jgi:hypothetical protein
MPDENTYGFRKEDAEALLQGIEPRESEYNENVPWNAPPIAVIIDAALDVATHALTGATSCLATICQWSDVDEEYSETTDQITVWNHSESDSYEVDTFGKAEWIDGHWWFNGDCGPMAAR